MADRFFSPRFVWPDGEGRPVPGGTLTFYEAASSTPKAVYSTAASDVALSNPVVLNADGTFTYVPDENCNGADEFSYTVTDGTAPSNTATVHITIDPVNDAPVVHDGTVHNVSENSTVSATLANLVSDADGDTLTLEVVDQPELGSVTFVTNTEVLAVEGDSKVSGLLLRNTATGEESKLPVTGVFVAIGHDPRSDLVRGLVDLDDEGYVQVQGRTTHTSLDGVFAAGDLVDHTYRQAITAAGSGCAAAIDAERWLAEHHS